MLIFPLMIFTLFCWLSLYTKPSFPILFSALAFEQYSGKQWHGNDTIKISPNGIILFASGLGGSLQQTAAGMYGVGMVDREIPRCNLYDLLGF